MNHRLKGLALVIGILFGISTVNCGKETIVERVEVQKVPQSIQEVECLMNP